MSGAGQKKNNDGKAQTTGDEDLKPTCGVVMPIANFDPYPPGHWADVLKIIGEAASMANFSARLVSDSPEVGVIQKRIVQNLYDDQIVVCDVSGRNPNVMFEMGVRLTFDKPTIIIQDEITSPPFDTSIIEYLTYPSDLNYYSTIEFKSKLAGKMSATFSKSKSDPNYSTFLKHFGEFRASQISTQEIPGYELLIKQIDGLRDEIRSARRADLKVESRVFEKSALKYSSTRIILSNASEKDAQSFRRALSNTKLGYTDEIDSIFIPGIGPSSISIDNILRESGLSSQAYRRDDSTIEILPF